jgi:hypothetical protein
MGTLVTNGDVTIDPKSDASLTLPEWRAVEAASAAFESAFASVRTAAFRRVIGELVAGGYQTDGWQEYGPDSSARVGACWRLTAIMCSQSKWYVVVFGSFALGPFTSVEEAMEAYDCATM